MEQDLHPGLLLRPARPADRRRVYEWMAASDVSPSMFGPPLYPELAVPTWQEFQADYLPHFFDGSLPERGRSFLIVVDGEDVGHLSQSGLVRAGGPGTSGGPQAQAGPAERSGGSATRETFCELDVWMRSLACCERGVGSAALELLGQHVESTLRPHELLIRPSARNPRAIRAYEKAGFRRVDLPPASMLARYGPGDADDAVVMLRDLRARVAGLPRPAPAANR
jgi:diamine N-acetyltransferase